MTSQTIAKLPSSLANKDRHFTQWSSSCELPLMKAIVDLIHQQMASIEGDVQTSLLMRPAVYISLS